ncbi:CS domain-containing protein [Mycena venus]|uniref:NudC domain-containing protein 1 n=1 Tax=Mycena venus TaxID=2733690 RepID=A0A8H6YQ80_9AGAR|nr:CS domain-containing protein [Mycena venus]
MSSPKHVLPHALQTPAIKKLAGKRIILASASPSHIQGIAPEIIPSKFEEDLPVSSFENIYEYPVATASHKAVEVYERLVESDPENAPDLVIAADTVVLTHALPSTTQTSFEMLPSIKQELLEKPESKEDNFRMLLDLNGGVCEVVTGLVVVYPVLTSPGYTIRSIDERSLVYFADNPRELIEAYVECGEGLTVAGGFAIQVILAAEVPWFGKLTVTTTTSSDFPAASFFRLLELIVEEDSDFLDFLKNRTPPSKRLYCSDRKPLASKFNRYHNQYYHINLNGAPMETFPQVLKRNVIARVTVFTCTLSHRSILHSTIMFTTNRSLLNPKFEGYKLDAIDQDRCVARHGLQYTVTQSTVSTNSPLSFQEVQSRITHNHLSVAPDDSRAVYVDAQYRVILVELHPETYIPSFRAMGELPRPIRTQNDAHHEYPSAAFLSSSEIFVSDGSGLLYIVRDLGPSVSFQLLGVYELPQSTPFKIHSISRLHSGEAVVVLSSRMYAASALKRQNAVDFDIWAVKFGLPFATSADGVGAQPLNIIWQRRGHAVPIHVGYDESRQIFMLLGDSPYDQVEAPIVLPYSPSADEMAPIPRANENLDKTLESLKPPPYSWTQTSDSVTVVFPLPSTTPKTNIKVTFSQQSLTLHVQNNIAPDIPLPHYSTKRLWGGISTSSSMWTWDREGEYHVGLLTLHLDKQHEGTRWSHVFESSGTSPEEAEVPETLDPSELWNIRESLEKYTAALRSGEDASGLGLGSGLPSLATGEMDDEVDDSVGRAAQLTWVGEDGSIPSWASQSSNLPSRLLSTQLPGRGSGNSLIVKNGIDGTVFSLESASSPEQPPKWIHTSTFPALSFVLASKTDTRFTYHVPSKAVFAFDNGVRDRAGNVYIYRAAPPTEKWAKQAVLSVGHGGSLLGVGAVKTEREPVLLCLTEKELILISNIGWC